MATHHHDLAFEICSGNLSNDVEARYGFRDFHFEIHFNCYFLSLLDHPYHAVVMLGRDSNLRKNVRCVCAVRTNPSTEEIAEALRGTRNACLRHEHRTAIAARAVKKSCGTLF